MAQPTSSPEIAAIVPVYRNQATVATLASRLLEAFDAAGIVGRVLFVVDASPDDSWQEISRLGQLDPRIGGLLLERNVGQHRAILCGLGAIRAHWYAIMDADLQDEPELVPHLLHRARTAAATALAERRGSYQNPLRMLTSRLFKGLLARLCGLPPRVGTFLVMSRVTVETLLARVPAHPQVVVMAGLYSPRLVTLPFHRARRQEGSSAYSTHGRVRAALGALACVVECRLGRHGGTVAAAVATINLP